MRKEQSANSVNVPLKVYLSDLFTFKLFGELKRNEGSKAVRNYKAIMTERTQET